MITSNIKKISTGVYLCPECKKFFGIKKLDEKAIALVNKHGVCPACAAKKRTKRDTIQIPEAGDERIVIAGPRGVTKHQMIAAIERNIDNPDNIKRLKDEYPATFAGSLRYVKKSIRLKATEIIGSIEEDEEKIELTKMLNPSRKGVTYHQIIVTIEKAFENQDYEIIKKIAKHFPEQLRGAKKYIVKKQREVIDSMIENAA